MLVEGSPNADVLTGTGEDDEIYGRQGNDRLFGLAGNDAVDGGLGADLMDGGAGNDTYFVENVGDRTVESLAGAAGGIDWVRVSIDWRLGANLENLRMHGPAIVGEGNGLDNVLTANGKANRLYGFAGNDTLFGLKGNDRLFGGAGDDTFVWMPSVPMIPNENDPVLVDDGADHIFGEGGSDTYVVPTASYIFGPDLVTIDNGVSANLATGTVDYIDTGFQRDRLYSIENIQTGNSTDRIIGSAGANVIESGGGYNVVRAIGGDDVIIGGVTENSGRRPHPDGHGVARGRRRQRRDRLRWELLAGASSPETSSFALTTDRLLGGGGNDRLIGGQGFVEMTGGAGADTFEARCDIFRGTRTTLELEPIDIRAPRATITDFAPGQGDRIELNIISTRLDDDRARGRCRGQRQLSSARATDIDVDEVGYSTVQRSDGSIDTIITYRFLATISARRLAPRSATSASCSRTTTAGSPTTGLPSSDLHALQR